MYFPFLLLFIAPFMNLIKNINLEYKLYPRWIKNRKDKSRVSCVKDEDCPFPSACCNDPFFPYEYCCYGWNKRKLQYAYSRNIIQKSQVKE